jgi:hypothetical protein
LPDVDPDAVTHHNENSGTAFEEWRQGLLDLTSSEEQARQWRRRRYRFAHLLGQQLVGPTATSPGLTGPAVYGVWLDWGLLYVGQTQEAERRLRDLPIGESHHLANTFPPEIWHRIVVIAWSRLPQGSQLLGALPSKVIGLALEHRLQLWLNPLANASRRTATGSFRDVDWSTSRSLGAHHAAGTDELFDAVRAVWLEAQKSAPEDRFGADVVRTVLPQTLL